MEDSNGRWFIFSVSKTSQIILEGKSLPEHLRSLESVDSPMTLTSVLCDLEDLGEVPLVKILAFIAFL